MLHGDARPRRPGRPSTSGGPGGPRANSERLKVPLGRAATAGRSYLDVKESAQGGMGPHGLVIGATGSGKSELLRTHGARLRRHPLLGDAQPRPRRLQGWRDVRRPGRAAAHRRGDHQPPGRPHPRRPHEGRDRRRAEPAAGGAARRRQLRVGPRLREGARRAAPTLRAAAEPLDHLRRVQRAALGEAGLHRPVPRDRPAWPVARGPPAALRRSASRKASCAGWTAISRTGSASRRSPRRRAARCSACPTRSSCRRSRALASSSSTPRWCGSRRRTSPASTPRCSRSRGPSRGAGSSGIDVDPVVFSTLFVPTMITAANGDESPAGAHAAPSADSDEAADGEAPVRTSVLDVMVEADAGAGPARARGVAAAAVRRADARPAAARAGDHARPRPLRPGIPAQRLAARRRSASSTGRSSSVATRCWPTSPARPGTRWSSARRRAARAPCSGR